MSFYWNGKVLSASIQLIWLTLNLLNLTQTVKHNSVQVTNSIAQPHIKIIKTLRLSVLFVHIHWYFSAVAFSKFQRLIHTNTSKSDDEKTWNRNDTKRYHKLNSFTEMNLNSEWKVDLFRNICIWTVIDLSPTEIVGIWSIWQALFILTSIYKFYRT